MASRRQDKAEQFKVKTITVDNLGLAIKNSINGGEMDEEDALLMANHILSFFGYNERIIDNVLEPEDRDAFYMLEDSGILTTEREETTLYDGREWRIHYWLFRKERIWELMNLSRPAKEGHRQSASVYDEIPDDAWPRRLAVNKK
ncbi:MAG: DUF6015 family protein [Methanomassiliicoccales archaeon]